jgi:hypothetical protein
MINRSYQTAGLVAIATLAATLGTQNPAAAALVGGATSVQDSGTSLEWLKLSLTDGNSLATATANNPGYSVANGTQVQGLLGSFFAQFGLPADPLSPPGDPTAAISATQFSAWTNLFGTTFQLGDIIGSGGRFNTGAGVARFGVVQSPISIPAFGVQAGSFAAFANGADDVTRTGVFLVRAAPATEVPTPALLPGLIGLGFSVFKRKKNQAVEA